MDWRQLDKELKAKRIAPAYLFYGTEDYLLERYLKILKELIIPPEAEAFDYQELDGRELTAADVVFHADTLPALAPRRLVVVKSPAAEILSSGAAALLAYLEDPAPASCLVIAIYGSIDRRLKVFKKFSEIGQAVEFAPLRGKALEACLRREAQEQGYDLTPEAAATLSEAGSLRQARNELLKAMNYMDKPGLIKLTDLQELLPPAMEGTIFQLVDALGNRNAPLAIKLLRQLLAMGEAPLGVVAMLARQLRLIYQYHLLGDRQKMIATLGLKPFVVNKVAAQSRNFSLASAGEALAELLKVDTGLKSGQAGAAVLLEKALWTIILKGEH